MANAPPGRPSAPVHGQRPGGPVPSPGPHFAPNTRNSPAAVAAAKASAIRAAAAAVGTGTSIIAAGAAAAATAGAGAGAGASTSASNPLLPRQNSNGRRPLGPADAPSPEHPGRGRPGPTAASGPGGAPAILMQPSTFNTEYMLRATAAAAAASAATSSQASHHAGPQAGPAFGTGSPTKRAAHEGGTGGRRVSHAGDGRQRGAGYGLHATPGAGQLLGVTVMGGAVPATGPPVHRAGGGGGGSGNRAGQLAPQQRPQPQLQPHHLLPPPHQPHSSRPSWPSSPSAVAAAAASAAASAASAAGPAAGRREDPGEDEFEYLGGYAEDEASGEDEEGEEEEGEEEAEGEEEGEEEASSGDSGDEEMRPRARASGGVSHVPPLPLHRGAAVPAIAGSGPGRPLSGGASRPPALPLPPGQPHQPPMYGQAQYINSPYGNPGLQYGSAAPQRFPWAASPTEAQRAAAAGQSMLQRRSSHGANGGGVIAAAAAVIAAAAASNGSGSGVSSREGSVSGGGSRPATASSVWSGHDLLIPPPSLNDARGGSGGGMAAARRASGSSGAMRAGGGAQGHAAERSARSSATGEAGKGGGKGGGGGGAGSRSSSARRRSVSQPRDAGTLSSRGGSGSGGDAPGWTLSRCNSAASTVSRGSVSRGAGGGSAGGSSGGRNRAAAQTAALIASLGLASPTTPGSAPASARNRFGPPSPARRKPGSAPPPHRPLHPAVFASPALLNPPKDGKVVDTVPTDAKGRAFPYVLPPVFPGTCPTISCVGHPADKQARGLQPLLSPTLLVKYGGVANTPVKAAFREAGFRPTRKGRRWLVQWGGILDAATFAKLHAFQRVNHFPGTWELGHKGHLYRNVYNARRRCRGGPAAEAFDIVPRFYVMPRDYEEFRQDVERFPERLYIQKPTNSSRGRGIRMVTRPDSIPRDAKDVLVQHYVANPLLLNGYKFDMRVYAAATCMDPLRLYVFHDGLARLATEPYSADKADLSKRCVHLTNYSVNKKSNKFVKAGAGGEAGPGAGAGAGAGGQAASAAALGRAGRASDPASECTGSKWSLSGLRAYLEARGLGPGWEAVWRQVCDIIAAAVIAAEPRMNTEFKMKVPHRNNCFEVWGFDIMLTDAFRAWLIEANTCPSLAADSGLDMRVKGTMVAELLHLLGPVPYDTEVYEKAAEAKRQARLTGLRAPAPAASPAGPGAGHGVQNAYGQAGSGSYGAVLAKTLQELESVDFTGLSTSELPDIVLEAEAEMARRGHWKRVFPCEDDPARYLELFETPRLNNMVLCKYYAQTGSHEGAGGGKARRQGPGGSGGAGSGAASSRPGTQERRPGG
ncbi:hypothetical protein HYH03_012961 [Edaphochlamys debaryana]|uniref:Tubulin--tyrosine ligase-like protein 9 n=1 Tax=Edaphochlamys debaryana TaxID=47281 RepID=A0A836BTL0_9CHLO|nr:hypothetical protein HYH03_012961 [Edaphochlamys debaryana]|eukprot:KAG2488455.1 hypothetical protein HYH03_012961 [Edaphochlamys debaryana]